MLSVDYITNGILNSRTYILSSKERDRVWLVDCGDVDFVLERIQGETVEGVLLTHTHSDHIYGLEALLKQFPSVQIYTNSYGVSALKSPKLNISRYHAEYPDISIDCPGNICVIKEGDNIAVLGEKGTVYETPGHDPSCVCYQLGNLFFTGDAYIPEVKVFTGFPYSERQQALQSVERILQLSKQCLIMPGHTVMEGSKATHSV